MKKFSNMEKMKVVYRYQTESVSYKQLSAQVGIDASSIRHWVRLVHHHGIEAFLYPYTKYSASFKLGVIQLIETENYSIREAAAQSHLPDPSMLRRWVNKWRIHGATAFPVCGEKEPMMPRQNDNQTSTDVKLNEMKKEMEQLRMENDYLKKLNALVQKRGRSQQATKPKSSLN